MSIEKMLYAVHVRMVDMDISEFLLIGLSKQLAKINNSSLTTTHSA